MIFFAFCWFFAILSCSSSADPMTASGTYKQGIMLANSKKGPVFSHQIDNSSKM